MKINAAKLYSSLFIIVILLQLYLSSFKANIIIQIVVLGFFFLFEKVSYSKYFFKSISPVILLFLIPFLGALIHKYALFNIVKDVFHFIKPLLGLLIGYFFYRKINNFQLFLKTIIYVALLSALIHLFMIFVFGDFSTTSLNTIRSDFGRDNFLELFALFFLGYYKKFEGRSLFENKKTHLLIFYILLLSNAIYFSRTMMGVAIVLLLSIYGYTIITQKTIKVIGLLVVFALLFYAYLFSIKLERNKPGIETILFKIKIAPAELFKTKIDRDNHKDLWDHWRGYEAKRALALMQEHPSSFVIGCGYGSLVNLKFWAPLSEDTKGMKYISELHNGYPYILYKTGIFGILIYLVFLIRLYKKIYEGQNFTFIFISAIGLIYIFTTLTISGIYNSKDIIVFILGALLFFQKKERLQSIES